MRTSKGNKHIGAGDRYYGGDSIIRDRDRINQEEDLKSDLGLFRLASVHKDFELSSAAPNVVLANLKIKFITKPKEGKKEKEIEYSFPISVYASNDNSNVTYYNGYNVDSTAFRNFHKSIMPDIQQFSRLNHYHSEAFMTYYLLSDDGKNFLVDSFARKGLIQIKGNSNEINTAADEELNGKKISNVKKVIGIGIDIHSTKVVCFNCAPFLQAATPRILDSIYDALSIKESEKVSEINFNVSANKNFDWRNISAPTFDHIPVKEDSDINLLLNTENLLGNKKTRLQKLGESTNRTFFLSGSSQPIDSDRVNAISLDKKEWELVTQEAAAQIQKAWKNHKKETIKDSLDDSITEQMAKASLEDNLDDSITEQMAKASLEDKTVQPSSSTSKVKSIKKLEGRNSKKEDTSPSLS